MNWLAWLFSPESWWLWLLMGGGAGVAAFFVPAILPALTAIWNALPSWARTALLAAGTLGASMLVAWSYGYRQRAAEEKARRANAAARRKEIDNEVGRLSDRDLDRELDRWMRD